MSRVIKFRAWDKKRMVFFSDLTIGIEKRYNNPYVYFKTDTFGGEVRLGTHEVMQFTGLLDKNGKEIYEGDILRSYFSNMEECKHQVSWSREFGGFGSMYINTANIPAPIDRMTQEWIMEFEKEVIGNIYENPDLIK